MKYLVISGNYQTALDRKTPKEAAQDAIFLWKHKKEKPTLSTLTTIVDSQKKKTYISTNILMENL